MLWNSVGAISRCQAFVRGRDVSRVHGHKTARCAEPVADQWPSQIADGPAFCNAKPDILILAVLLALGKADAIAQDAHRNDHRRRAKEHPVRPDLEKPLNLLGASIGLDSP